MKILYVTRMAPYPTDNGGGQRSALIFDALKAVGEVDTVVLGKPEMLGVAAIEVLKRDFSLKAVIPATPRGYQGRSKWLRRIYHNLDGSRSSFKPSPDAVARLRELVDLDQYDLVVGRYLRSLACVGFPRGRKGSILDIDDLDSEIYNTRANNSTGIHSWINRYHASNIKKLEHALLAKPDHCWVANPENLSIDDPRALSLLPNIPYLNHPPEALPFKDGSERTILFLAGFKHRANVDGARWFFTEVWPAVISQIPDARIKVCGSGLTEALQFEFSRHKGVEAIGFVEDLKEAYRESLLSICPVIYGAGTNMKVLESFCFGRVCVLSGVASRGFRSYPEFKNQLDVGQSPAGMSRRLIYYLDNPQEAKTKGELMASIMSSSANREDFNNMVSTTIQQLVSEA